MAGLPKAQFEDDKQGVPICRTIAISYPLNRTALVLEPMPFGSGFRAVERLSSAEQRRPGHYSRKRSPLRRLRHGFARRAASNPCDFDRSPALRRACCGGGRGARDWRPLRPTEREGLSVMDLEGRGVAAALAAVAGPDDADHGRRNVPIAEPRWRLLCRRFTPF